MKSNKFSVVFRINSDFVSLCVLEALCVPVLAKKAKREQTLGFYQEPPAVPPVPVLLGSADAHVLQLQKCRLYLLASPALAPDQLHSHSALTLPFFNVTGQHNCAESRVLCLFLE